MTTRRFTHALLLIVVLHAVVSASYAMRRPIDGDEGYYALASRLVSEGQSPYADFFYPQGPLMPYVYAPIVSLAGPHLLALRGFSVALGTLGVLVWALWLRRRSADRPAVAVVAFLALAASPGLLDWNLTVKTYALANLCASAGLVGLAAALRAARPARWLAAGGVALGLAASARLLYAPLAVVPAGALLVGFGGGSGRDRARSTLAWAGGLAIGTAPLWITLARDPGRFWFNNLRYHQMRVLPTGHDDPLARVGAALAVLGRALASDPFLLATLLLAVWGVWSWRRRRETDSGRRFEHVVALGLTVHVLTNLFPDPVHEQYFTATLAPLALPLIAGGLTRLPERVVRWGPPVLGAVLLALAGVTLGQSRSGMSADPVWRLDHFRRTCAKIEELTRPDDVILAFWPGYTFETGRRPQPGTENQFGLGVSSALSPRERARYRIIGWEELMRAFLVDRPDLVIIGTWMHGANQALSDAEAARLLDVMRRQYEAVHIDGPVQLCLPRREPRS